MKNTIHLLGYAFGLGANLHGCSDGPCYLKQSGLLTPQNLKGVAVQWDAMLPTPTTQFHIDKYAATAYACEQLAFYTQQLTQQNKFFITLGGDHSSAIGTWSGVFASLQSRGPLGLLWVDAHLDSHTPQSSQSGNIHGMPLACLLGYGDAQLINIASPLAKLKPEHVALVGIRSYESAEMHLLKQLGVRIFLMDEIKQRGLKAVMQEALSIVKMGTSHYGLSIDIDAIEPIDAPGTSTPVADGINGDEFCSLLNSLLANDPNLLGMEIVEFNPHEDINNKTAQLIYRLIYEIC